MLWRQRRPAQGVMHTDLRVGAVAFPGEGRCDGEAGHGKIGPEAVALRGIDLQIQGWLDPSHRQYHGSRSLVDEVLIVA